MSESARPFIPANELGVSPKQSHEQQEARIEEIVRTEAQNYLQAAYKMVERPLQQHQMDRVRGKVRQADYDYDRASNVLFEVDTGGETLPAMSRLLADGSGARFESLNEVSNRISDFANPEIDKSPSYSFPDQVERLNITTRELFKILQKDFSFSRFGQENIQVLSQAFIHRVAEALRDEAADSQRKKSGEKRSESVELTKAEAEALQKGFYEFLQKSRPEVAAKLMTYMSKENTNATVYLEQIITAQDIIDFFDLVDLGEIVLPVEVKSRLSIADLIKEFLRGFNHALKGGELHQGELNTASRKVRRFGHYEYVADRVLGPATPLPDLAAQKRALFMPDLSGPRGREFSAAQKLVESRDIIKRYNDTMTAYLKEVHVTPDNPRVDNAWMVHEVTQLLMSVEAIFHDVNVNLDQELKGKVSLDAVDSPKFRLGIRQSAVQNALKELVRMQKKGYDGGVIQVEEALKSAIHPRTLEHYFEPVKLAGFYDKELQEFTKNSKALAQFTEQITEVLKKVSEIGAKVRERNQRVRELALQYFKESSAGGEEITPAEVQGELESLGIDGEINPEILARLRDEKSEMSLEELLKTSQTEASSTSADATSSTTS